MRKQIYKKKLINLLAYQSLKSRVTYLCMYEYSYIYMYVCMYVYIYIYMYSHERYVNKFIKKINKFFRVSLTEFTHYNYNMAHTEHTYIHLILYIYY